MNHSTKPQVTTSPGVLESALLLVPHPIVIFEGMELKVTYINDALLEIWSKDRSILGQTFTEILPELEDQPFPALLRRVIETGETRTDIEAPAYFLRDGVPQTIYFDYSYTAIKNEQSESVGVIVVCNDVTDRVIAKQQLKQSEERFRSMVMQAPFAIAVVHGPEFIIDMANSRSLDIWGRTSDVLGKRVIDVFPELIEQGFVDILTNVYEKAEPFFGNEVPVQLIKNGKPTDAYLNFVYHPIVENNQVTSIMSVGYDVTDLVLSRKHAESQKTLLEYLNSAGEELALSLDTKTALDKISKLIVPKFADWFTINVLNGERLDILMVVNKDEDTCGGQRITG
jgi:PAS domain S-box-containing protein